jgi:hypothetical protein
MNLGGLCRADSSTLRHSRPPSLPIRRDIYLLLTLEVGIGIGIKVKVQIPWNTMQLLRVQAIYGGVRGEVT